jgi:predicted metal-dependent hydrolase
VNHLSFNPSNIQSGLELFNGGRFFDAHEVWEDAWREIPRDRAARRHVQGLVQMAVAFHHWTTGNAVGARSVLARSLRNLHGAESSFSSIDVARLRSDAEFWLRYLENFSNARGEGGKRHEHVPAGIPPLLPTILPLR